MSKQLYRLMSVLLILCIGSMALPLRGVYAQDEELISKPTDEYSADFAIEWMQLLYDRIMVEGINPPAAARIYGYAGVTLYQAVLPGMPINNTLAGQLNGLNDLPLPDAKLEYDWSLSADAALALVIGGLLSKDNAETAAAIQKLREKQISARKGEGLDAAIIKRSLAFGESVGKGIMEWVSTDYFAETRDMTFEMPEGEQFWVPTTPGTKAVEPNWGQIRPFLLSYSGECDIPPRMEFSTDKNSTFYKQALEVKEAGDNLTQEQKDIANFWLDNLKATGTPAGHWVMIESQIARQLKLTLARSAEMYAIVGIALADAFIACWNLKYQINLLRPETYIQRYIRAQWKPYIQTPAFPEYPSGHSVVSAAAADTLTYLFGTVAFTDSSKTRFNMKPRSFTSFGAAASEAAISRLYGGIHFRNAIELGMKMGSCVAGRVTSSIDMKPVPQGE
ncbi:MAG: vanadium-dependent haloperoxidase [Anaerolineae bacterium]